MLCNHTEGDTSKLVKADELKSAGAVGAIFVNDVENAVATTYLDFPVTDVTAAAAAAIQKYIASTRYGSAPTISQSFTQNELKASSLTCQN